MDSEWRIQQLESCDCIKSCKVNGTMVADGVVWQEGCDRWMCQVRRLALYRTALLLFLLDHLHFHLLTLFIFLFLSALSYSAFETLLSS